MKAHCIPSIKARSIPGTKGRAVMAGQLPGTKVCGAAGSVGAR